MLSVVIQAGGQSSRMGEDKALKPFLGRPLIQRVIERLASIADELIVTTNRPADYEFLNASTSSAQRVRLMPDLKPGRGALGGLHTAIASARVIRSSQWSHATCPSRVKASSKAHTG
ncbi:MAG: hypothetical protein DYG86_12580 [Chloroflexi bacterium CFX2]|nr:hypothetical protein [Chloroflexi bacterium CFX2]